MSAFGALWYADWRGAINDGRRVLRSPGRSLIWIAYAVVLGLFIWTRAVMSHRGRTGASVSIAPVDYFVCVLLESLVFSLATGRGAIGIFRSRVEARFIIGSPVAAPLAIAYLQVRETVAQSFRFLFSLIYLLFIFGPREIGVGALLADIALVLGVYAAAAAIAVPRRLLSRRAGLVCAIVGVPPALLALAPAVRDAVGQLPIAPPLAGWVLAFVPAWHPGRVLLEPSAGWLVAVVGLAAAAIGVLAAAGRDAYPELYALSIARIELRERRWMRSNEPAPATARRALTPDWRVKVPRGVLAFVWKSVVEFGRGRRLQSIFGGAALWCVVGFAAARFALAAGDTVFWTLASVVVNVVFVVGISSTNALAGELRRPLFWLAPAAMFERLSALALAQIWRPILTLELVAIGFVAGGDTSAQTLVFALGLPALVALLAAVGFAGSALFPSSADARGPVAALRLGVAAVLLVPPFVLYGVGAAAFAAPVTALVAAALLALIEAGALIGVAAWRLDGQVDRLPALP